MFALSATCATSAQEPSPAQPQSADGNAPIVPPQPPPDSQAGQFIEWEDWSFRWQFRDIEGLVLTDVHFNKRKVLKYIGLAEIYVPYATGWPRPEDFALGGFRANPMPLQLGRDCTPGGSQCRAFNRDGSPAVDKTADVMMHEEPLAMVYAGTQGRATGKMLVLWSMVHFPGPQDGYTYILRWKFQSDGTLCPEVGASGGLQHLNVGAETGRGVVVGHDDEGGQVFAPSHVHNFYFRIDFDIDGAEGNCVEEFNYETDAIDPVQARATWRKVLLERGRFLNEPTFRSWRALNPTSLNVMGRPRSYHLIPGGKGSWRDGLPNKTLSGDIFVTKYHASEFPYSSADDRRMLDALTNYLNNEQVESTDVVVWYRLSFAHHPRSEEWPAQPVVWHHFELVPRDFLDASPLTPIK